MRLQNQDIRRGEVLFLALALMWITASCARVQDVRVRYQVPAPSNELAGKRVFIDLQDRREDVRILGKGALKEYTYHSGNVDLIVSQGVKAPPSTESKSIPSLFRDVFSRRIQALGGETVCRRAEADVFLVVALDAFSLDFEDRTWFARMAYEAQVVRNGQVRARQSMTGEAERVKILGLQQADQVMGDLFTDVVNRLDIPELFHKAGH